MDVYLNELRLWSVANNMLINEHKTEEMIISLSHTVTVRNYTRAQKLLRWATVWPQ